MKLSLMIPENEAEKLLLRVRPCVPQEGQGFHIEDLAYPCEMPESKKIQIGVQEDRSEAKAIRASIKSAPAAIQPEPGQNAIINFIPYPDNSKNIPDSKRQSGDKKEVGVHSLRHSLPHIYLKKEH